VSSAIVDKYIGESARLIREMFSYARDHQPCIIFMDEIDAIGKWSMKNMCIVMKSQKKFSSILHMLIICGYCKSVTMLNVVFVTDSELLFQT